jgi:DNA ligase D-like protein (predicted ligase)
MPSRNKVTQVETNPTAEVSPVPSHCDDGDDGLRFDYYSRVWNMPTAESKLPTAIRPMLAQLTRNPFDSAKHLFELKWDGIRGLAFVQGGELRLFSRTGRDITDQFPELEDMPKLLKSDSVVLDGEIVCLDEANHPSFARLQQRIGGRRRVKRPRVNPAHYIAFDVLHVGGSSVMKDPLIQRKNRLHDVLKPTELIQASEFIENDGTAFFEATCELGLEGIMAKEKNSSYQPGKRSPAWLKVKRVRESEFVIGGYSFGGKRKETFSSLLLGLYDDRGKLVHAGNVGNGFTQSEAKKILSILQDLHTEKSPFATPPAGLESFVYWCHPELVCEVNYGEFTEENKLRYAVYLRLRPDKDPKECTLSDAPGWPGNRATMVDVG